MTPVVIVAHGQPSDPAPAAADLDRLAAQVAALLPGHALRSATLAQPGALETEVQDSPDGRIFPLFMAGGWFTRSLIPGRLAAAGAIGWRVLEPFGCDPALHDLVVRIAAESGAERVLLAAHGSMKSPVPGRIAARVAARIAAETGIPASAAFIDQTPRIEAAAGHGPASLCLPFFAQAGGHVTQDIPAALAKAGFRGRLVDPVGLHPSVPGLIARAIAAGVPVCDGPCRWA